MKSTWKKVLVVCCSAIMLLTAFSGVVSAGWIYPEEYPGSGYNISEKIPTTIPDEWTTLGKVVSTKQTAKYFILTVMAGEHEEALYISLPKEGGVRMQSMHEAQKAAGLTEPEMNNAGELEPSGLSTIDYKTSGSDVVLTGTDGTAVRYTATKNGFELQFSDAAARIVNLTNEQITYGYNRKGEVVSIVTEMPLIEKEAIYGGGERFDDTNHVGHYFSLTNLDSPSSDHFTYVNVPLFHSNRGYSVWFNMTGVGHADFGATDPDKYTVRFDQENLDFYLWTGLPLENLKKYTDITGTSGVSETWTYGFWTGAASAAFDGSKKKNAYANLQYLLEGYKDNYNFYPEAIYAEGSNSQQAQPLAYAKERGVRSFFWYHPATSLHHFMPGYSEYATYDDQGKELTSGWPLRFNTNILNMYGIYQHIPESRDHYMDFSNPSAVLGITNYFSQMWDWGLSGSMIDYGEAYRFDGTYYNGEEGSTMHNFISYYYAKAMNEAWTNRFGNDYVLFERSGTAGSQYYVGNFLGDQQGTWEGLQDQITAMVTFGASGYNLYGGDLGSLLSKPTSNLWNRWVVLSTFSPYMRQHGYLWAPWEDFDNLTAETFGNYYYFRKNIVPTVESAAIDANKTSNPIVKGMMMAYPYQLPLADINNQYLFCDDFLVCAVTEENTWYKQVALPKGSTWYDLYSYQAYSGGQIMYAEAPTSTMPVFVKGGAVKAINLSASLTLGAEMHDDSGDEFEAFPALLITPPDAERTSTIHVKDGASTDYRTYDSHTEVYTNKPGEGSSFTVTNTEGSDREAVIALGVAAAEVTVDGKKLTRLDHMPDYMSYEYGYYVDREGLTTILLEPGWKELSITEGDSAYTPFTMTAGAGMNALTDGKFETAYNFSPKEGAYVDVELDKVTEIGRIVVKWAVGYAETYDIEYSEDGETWYLLSVNEGDANTVTGSIGSVDKLDFAPVKAKYLRLYSMKKATDVVSLPSVYSLEVYAPYTFEPIVEKDPDDTQQDIGNEEDDWSDEEWADWEDEDEDINGSEGLDDGDGEDGEEDTEIIEEVITKRRKKNTITTGWPLWLIIVVIAAGVLVITGLLLLLLLLKRKKKQKEAEAALADENGDIDFPNPAEK